MREKLPRLVGSRLVDLGVGEFDQSLLKERILRIIQECQDLLFSNYRFEMGLMSYTLETSTISNPLSTVVSSTPVHQPAYKDGVSLLESRNEISFQDAYGGLEDSEMYQRQVEKLYRPNQERTIESICNICVVPSEQGSFEELHEMRIREFATGFKTHSPDHISKEHHHNHHWLGEAENHGPPSPESPQARTGHPDVSISSEGCEAFETFPIWETTTI